jgi:hypothetical protein
VYGGETQTLTAAVWHAIATFTSIDKSGEQVLFMMIRDGAEFVAAGLSGTPVGKPESANCNIGGIQIIG